MIKIYNTKTRKLEEFVPISDKQTSMYVCGPTVYSDIHIGNARPVIVFDMVKKYLDYLNYNVHYVSNITDVDDKIIDEAKRLGIEERELTEKYTKHFIDATKYVGSNIPDEMPRATNYITEMIEYISELIKNGFAYETLSGVYFDVSKQSKYGEISNRNTTDLIESVRIENKEDKRDSKDFSIWKKTDEGLSYDSPWGKGRPGWHTECAVMNHEIFEGMIDIHGGGSDLIFPHHENENIQTIAHSNHGLANFWMHVGRVDFKDVKMSKSLGNTVLVKDLEDPIAYRFLVLAHHYRRPISFNEELYEEYIDVYNRLINSLKRTSLKLGLDYDKDLYNDVLIDKFKEEMNNDFNTANVISVILSEIKNINKTNDIIVLSKLYNTIILMLDILGLKPEIDLTVDIISKYNNWEQARLNKDYVLADKLRNELSTEGWV